MYNVAIAAGNSVKPGGTYTVTWADGGTSSYRVITNSPGVGSAKLDPMATQETFGDGTVKPGPICGKA
jgi:hypothetical protein